MLYGKSDRWYYGSSNRVAVSREKVISYIVQVDRYSYTLAPLLTTGSDTLRDNPVVDGLMPVDIVVGRGHRVLEPRGAVEEQHLIRL